MTDLLWTWSACRLSRAIRRRELSSRELLELYLSRVERYDPAVNAVVTLDADRALADARRADDEAVRGDWRGPLHGLPVTIKDAIAVEGVRSTAGAIELTDYRPAEDAAAVARLRRAGAVVFGKTNVPRWSMDFQTFNEIFGTTNNPWALDRVPGGSSGGAAAAVACGFAAFELGTDLAGSVRIPAHCCGVFGLKPSYGVVPQRGYLDHLGGGVADVDINVVGPLARSAEDLDLLLGVLAGPPDERAFAWRLELPPPRASRLEGLRVAAWFEDPACPIDDEELALLRSAADRLADAGAKVDERRPPIDFREQRKVFFQLLAAATAPTLAPEAAERAGGSHLAWLAADEARARLKAQWRAFFETCDILLCPVMPTPAFPHDQSEPTFSRTISVNGEQQPYRQVMAWAGLVGVVELPSVSAPIGRTPGGLPVGVQVVAPYLRDREAIWAAGLVAEVSGGGFVPPPGY